MQKGWSEKMPDFVRRLEDALYRTAHSKVRPELKTLAAQYLILLTSPCNIPRDCILRLIQVTSSFREPFFVV